MIISKTPYRISFFGGGSDFPEHFRQYGSSVLACAINKYCFLNVRRLPPFFEHKYRAVYSRIENISEINEFQHPSVKAVLKYFDLPEGISVIHDGDIPARSPGFNAPSSGTNSMVLLLTQYAFPFNEGEKLNGLFFNSLFRSTMGWSWVNSMRMVEFCEITPPVYAFTYGA